MNRGKQIGALLLALLLVASLGATAMAAGSSSLASTQEAPENVDGADEADEVYVTEDGDAVLVYEETSDDPEAQAVAGSFGLETQTGLMHVLYNANFSEMDEDAQDELEMTGDMSMYMTPETVASSADLTFTDTEDLEEFEASVDLEQSSTNYHSDIDFAMTVVEDNWVEDEQWVEFEATTETTATTFSSTGMMTMEMGAEPGPTNDEAIDLTLTQDGDQYDLSVSEIRSVPSYAEGNWESEADARTTLENEYRGVAMGLGGQADVTLESYAYSGDMVELEYTVEFTGINDQLSEMIAMNLQQDPEFDFDETEARAIADRLVALEIDEMHVSVQPDGSQVTVDWNVELDNYDEVVLGVVEVAESIDDVDDEMADQFDEVRAMLEAQQASDLVQTNEIEFYTSETPDQTTLEFSMTSDAENWADYVSELEDRGVEQFAAETELTFDAETVGDELHVTYDFESTEDAMLEQVLDEYETAIENDPMIDDEVLEAIQSFREAEFEIARATMSVTEEEAEFEAAMAFEDMTELEGVPFEVDDELTVSAVHAETEDGTTTFYITAEGYVGANADESEVREKRHVGEDTDVHLPGEWDREFPSIDEDEVRSYLEDATGDDSSLLPVDTTTALIGVAVVGGLFVAYRKFY
ncbi:hypothetical protein ACLI4Q_03515 [Natrialbaceae archaeon A-CW1-1]